MKGIAQVRKVSEEAREKPTFSLSAKDLPEMKDWKVGKKYNLEMTVEQVSMSKDDWDDKGLSGRFKVLNVSCDDDEDDEDDE